MKHILRVLAIIPALLLFTVLLPAPAMAADLRNGDTVIIASGDVVNDDLYIAANQIIINGTINGDVLGIAETITVNGKINGSVMAIGATISIGGEVTHAARLAGNSIDISGKVGGDVAATGNNLDISRLASVGRDLLFAARRAQVDAQVDDSIKGAADTVILSNVVGKDVDIHVTNLTIASTANIRGSLTYVSDNEASIQPGAQIGGTTTRNLPKAREVDRYSDVWTGVIAYLMTLVTGCVIILLAPKRAASVASAIKRQPWLSLGWGAVILFAAPLAIIITLITVIGVPIGLLGLVLYGIAIYLSQIAVGLFVGYWILGYFSKVDSRLTLIGAFALGFTLLTLLKLIPVVGFFLWLATVLFGIGAMVLSQRVNRPVVQVAIPEPIAK